MRQPVNVLFDAAFNASSQLRFRLERRQEPDRRVGAMYQNLSEADKEVLRNLTSKDACNIRKECVQAVIVPEGWPYGS